MVFKNMANPFGYDEEREFISLKEQCEERQAEQANLDESQSDKLVELEKRIAVLEEKLAVSETKETLNKIENMSEGESLDVVLSADVDTEKSVIVKPNTQVTLDLNEKAIKVVKPNIDGILVEDGATLTINGNGLVESANGGDGYPIIANGKLIINSGHFKSGYDASNLANACVYARGNGDIEIYGGRFEGVDGSFVLNKKDADRATTSIKVMGGEFVDFNPSNNASEGPNTNFVPTGYKVESFTEGDKTIYKVITE